jgi:hypothetical protein
MMPPSPSLVYYCNTWSHNVCGVRKCDHDDDARDSFNFMMIEGHPWDRLPKRASAAVFVPTSVASRPGPVGLRGAPSVFHSYPRFKLVHFFTGGARSLWWCTVLMRGRAERPETRRNTTLQVACLLTKLSQQLLPASQAGYYIGSTATHTSSPCIARYHMVHTSRTLTHTCARPSNVTRCESR